MEHRCLIPDDPNKPTEALDESQLKGKSPEEKYTMRQEKSKALLNQFKEWLDKSALQVPPKTLIGKAVHYSLRQWQKLSRYSEDGNLPIDNNRAERAIKPFVIGRKNWMFSNTSNGAEASATLYGIIETAKANDIDPLDYVRHLLTEIPKRESIDDMSDLMPWNVKHLGGVK